MKAVRRCEVDAIVVWKLDRWGQSLPDLIASLAELLAVGL
jgi:DNA invertase Pin-like site-specific DNA recombinase